MKKKDKYIVLSICRESLISGYPVKYQQDTKKYPVFQEYLDGEDDNIFIVHEADIGHIECELDSIEPYTFFDFGNVVKMTVESIDSEECADVWLDKHHGNPVGTERDRRESKSADGLMIPNSGQLKRLEK